MALRRRGGNLFVVQNPAISSAAIAIEHSLAQPEKEVGGISDTFPSREADRGAGLRKGDGYRHCVGNNGDGTRLSEQ